MYYTYCMALGSTSVGRPYFEAAIPFQSDRANQCLDEFYNICASFHVQDVIQVSRGLGVTERTVRNWKYGVTFPKLDIALDVIEWDKLGRPLRKRYQSRGRQGVM